MFKYIGIKFCQVALAVFPLKFSYFLAKLIADIKYFFSTKDKKAVMDNLRLIMPPGSDIKKASKEVFYNFGKYLIEFFRRDRFTDKDFIGHNIDIINLENIKKVLDRGKGGIILTAHLGNWELGAQVLSLLGYPLSVVALPHEERSVNEIFDNNRSKAGIKVISSKMAIKKCLNLLKQNGLIALVGDRDFTFKGEKVDFLGKTAIMPRGAAVLAQKTGAAIIPCFLIRKEENRFILSVHDPIFVNEDYEKNNKEKIRGIMRQYLDVVEDKIKEYPEQWIIFREFWHSEDIHNNPGL